MLDKCYKFGMLKNVLSFVNDVSWYIQRVPRCLFFSSNAQIMYLSTADVVLYKEYLLHIQTVTKTRQSD